jgi:hypothetical protein
LDAEYDDLSRRLVAKLARKRPSPLLRGDARVWAAGVLYALGQINFLFDRSQTPHLSADRLSEVIEVKKTTMANKARLVRDLAGLSYFDSEFGRQAIINQSPLTWLIQLDELVVDARTLTPELQWAAYQRGLIPYVPALGSGDG